MIFETIHSLVRRLMILALVFLSIEILVRRWAWGQIPTQIPAFMVYALLAFNAIELVRRLRA